MARNLEFTGRSTLDKTSYKGTGVNQINGELWIINGEELVCPIEDTSLRIRDLNQYEKYENPITSLKDLSDLQHLLTNAVISFCKERNLNDIDRLSFGVDGIQDSIEFGEWTPSTDSSLIAYGYENEKQKIIGEAI
jgi:hypothetical protein